MYYAAAAPISASGEPSIVLPRRSEMDTKHLNRRDFLKVMGTAGASLVIGVYLGGCDVLRNSVGAAAPEGDSSPFEPNIYLKIDAQGLVTITAFRSEMGQGIRTAIAMIVADELGADWENIRIEQADADPAYGNQATGGSASINTYYSPLRRAGAVAREMLKAAAAAQWDVAPDDCQVELGNVVHPKGKKKLSFGDLAGPASEQEKPEAWSVPLKEAKDFRIIGKDFGHWDTPAIVTGRAVYGSDVKLPNMLYATIARCPVFGGSVADYDPALALAVTGVKGVHAIDDWVAVVGENSWAAIKGRDLLDITWDEGPNAGKSSQALRADLADRAPEVGSAEAPKIDAVYEFPYQAHASMEPMNCVADVREDAVEIWAPSQNPQEIQSRVARALRVSPNQISVHVTLMGGGFGRRLESDYAVEAAQVSAVVGAPVQVIWTREDDIRHDFYHPLSYQYAAGDPQDVTYPAVRSFNGEGYIPTGAWRSVYNHTDAYARECFIDELAMAAGLDSLEHRLELYSRRGRAVIELAAAKAGWGEPLQEFWGRGLAYHATFNVTHVAMVAEVEVIPGQDVRVQRMICAVDCGLAVNPDNIAAQMEGGIAFGLTAALKAGVTLERGRILESNFHDCPILRIDEMPVVEVHIVDSDADPSGMGEMGVPPVAPAVANAVFDATGVRIRHLPIKRTDLI
jgi:isoquinoline 1-oxidoreductase subunit beta